MNIVVTGAGGFVGSHLAERLVKEGHDVKGVSLDYPDGGRPDYEFLLLDLREKDACAFAVRRAERVYHAAADMGGIGYITKDHARIAHNNALIDLNMLRAASEAGVKRFWYAGAACVYPSFKQAQPDIPPLKETDDIPADPEPGYGWAKLFGEQMCRYYGEETRMQTRITRFFNVYGPGAAFDGNREKALMALCRKVALAKDGDEIEVWGDGQQVRDFTYVTDAMDAVIRVMESEIRTPVNVGNSSPITISALVGLLAKIAGKEIRTRFDLSKPQGVRGRVADGTLLRSLGWAPQVSLEEGVRHSYEWVRNEMGVAV